MSRLHTTGQRLQRGPDLQHDFFGLIALVAPTDTNDSVSACPPLSSSTF
jgi:hypothetical protein